MYEQLCKKCLYVYSTTRPQSVPGETDVNNSTCTDESTRGRKSSLKTNDPENSRRDSLDSSSSTTSSSYINLGHRPKLLSYV